jgi:hypothetical protein
MKAKIDALVMLATQTETTLPVTPKVQRAEGAHSHAGALS